jgi:hypothetical protein
MSTYTTTQTETFTIAHAKYLASKVATDLKKFQRFYTNGPTDEWIDKYERELAVMLKYKTLNWVVYGFKRGEKWTEASIRYTMLPNGSLASDDDPGKIRPGLDVSGATFTSFLRYDYSGLTDEQRRALGRELPFERGSGSAPELEAGYWADDLNYGAGGRGIGRATVRK